MLCLIRPLSLESWPHSHYGSPRTCLRDLLPQGGWFQTKGPKCRVLWLLLPDQDRGQPRGQGGSFPWRQEIPWDSLPLCLPKALISLDDRNLGHFHPSFLPLSFTPGQPCGLTAFPVSPGSPRIFSHRCSPNNIRAHLILLASASQRSWSQTNTMAMSGKPAFYPTRPLQGVLWPLGKTTHHI